jgi:hypothetical protein
MERHMKRSISTAATAAVEHLLDDLAVSQITGRARSTLQKDRVRGGGIPFVHVGRLVRYRPADVAAWLAALPACDSTSEGRGQ